MGNVRIFQALLPSHSETLQEAYLFKAAMSEARTEITMRTRKETAAINTATSALRREVESLQVKMQEEIANLKHE